MRRLSALDTAQDRCANEKACNLCKGCHSLYKMQSAASTIKASWLHSCVVVACTRCNQLSVQSKLQAVLLRPAVQNIPVIRQLISDRAHWETKPPNPFVCLATSADAGDHGLSNSLVAIVYSKAAHDPLLFPPTDWGASKRVSVRVVRIFVFKTCRRLPIASSAAFTKR